MIGRRGVEHARDTEQPGSPTGVSDPAVRGERAGSIVHAARSVQSRASAFLSAVLMIALGVSALTWYYAHALTRSAQVRESARKASVQRAQGEMPLPALGRIYPPQPTGPSAVKLAEPTKDHAELPVAETRTDPLPESVRVPIPEIGGPMQVQPTAPTGHRTALARRLAGAVLVRSSDWQTQQTIDTKSTGTLAAPGTTTTSFPVTDSGSIRGAHSEESLGELLHAPVTPTVQAQMLPTQRFLLPQGSFIDCTLETAIDSTLPGMTTCITATDTFGADGKVVLLERGTKLVGETRGQVQQGQARVFVLWTQARTPGGVVVPLASPGTDELGRAGLPGEVERHFWQRFGAAMLITLIDGAVQAGVQASAGSGGTVIYAPSTSQNVLTEVLKETVAIPPTVVKRNGDRIQVLVARDLDFRPVYELRVAASGP